jgi:hypothetical protein
MRSRLQGRRRAGDHAALREGFGLLLRALYPACPHITPVLWQELGYAAAQGDLLDAPWPQVDEARWCRTRSSWCCRSTASCAAIQVPAGRQQGRDRGPRWPATPSSLQRRQADQEGGRGARAPGQRGGLSAMPTPRRGRRCWPLAAAGAGGCGFELRRAPRMPFRSIHLALLRAALAAGRRVAPPARRHGRRRGDRMAAPRRPTWCCRRWRCSASARGRSTATGEVREFQLRLRFSFRAAHARVGASCCPSYRDLLSAIDMSYSEPAALAKQQPRR